MKPRAARREDGAMCCTIQKRARATNQTSVRRLMRGSLAYGRIHRPPVSVAYILTFLKPHSSAALVPLGMPLSRAEPTSRTMRLRRSGSSGMMAYSLLSSNSLSAILPCDCERASAAESGCGDPGLAGVLAGSGVGTSRSTGLVGRGDWE